MGRMETRPQHTHWEQGWRCSTVCCFGVQLTDPSQSVGFYQLLCLLVFITGGQGPKGADGAQGPPGECAAAAAAATTKSGPGLS